MPIELDFDDVLTKVQAKHREDVKSCARPTIPPVEWRNLVFGTCLSHKRRRSPKTKVLIVLCVSKWVPCMHGKWRKWVEIEFSNVRSVASKSVFRCSIKKQFQVASLDFPPAKLFLYDYSFRHLNSIQYFCMDAIATLLATLAATLYASRYILGVIRNSNYSFYSYLTTT